MRGRQGQYRRSICGRIDKDSPQSYEDTKKGGKNFYREERKEQQLTAESAGNAENSKDIHRKGREERKEQQFIAESAKNAEVKRFATEGTEFTEGSGFAHGLHG